jgi:cyanophycinase-like exopeptidase
MKHQLSIAFILITSILSAQNYVSYFTGNTSNITTTPEFGVCMMGGASENDNASQWFLERANGGDIVVLRASGSDGYNDYFYSDLGVNVNSVETLKILNLAGATDPYVLDKVANAEAIWFAGGDQYDYVSYFKDNEMEDLLNAHVNEKGGVIGGTSAGMAILGGHYFDAQNGTVTSALAISDPYHNKVSIGHRDFLDIPYLKNVITDTHYDDPDRRGRHTVFMARIIADSEDPIRPIGLACEEYTAICIDNEGAARVYGSYPAEEDYVYFIQPRCADYEPDVILLGAPLIWEDGVIAYKIPATEDGLFAVDLNVFADLAIEQDNTEWQQWSVYQNSNTISVTESDNPDCALLSNQEVGSDNILVYPNPFINALVIKNVPNAIITVVDVLGKKQHVIFNSASETIDTSHLPKGIYFLEVETENGVSVFKLMKN